MPIGTAGGVVFSNEPSALVVDEVGRVGGSGIRATAYPYVVEKAGHRDALDLDGAELQAIGVVGAEGGVVQVSRETGVYRLTEMSKHGSVPPSYRGLPRSFFSE